MTTKGNRPIITRPGFSLVPSALLDACKARKGTVFVYANLWDHASGDPGNRGNAFPSVETQAKQCGMDAKDIREARRWLEDNGWLDRKDRPGLTPMFKVRLEQRERRSHRPTPGGNGPRVKTPTPPLGEMAHPTPGGNAPPINNPLTRTNDQEVLEPPLPPAAQGALRPEAVAAHPRRDRDGFVVNPDQQPQATEAQPQPTQPVKPWESPQQPKPQTPPEPQQALATVPVDPQPKSRKVSFTPTEGDVPAALLPVVSELLEFWPARSGAKTQRAWNLMLSEATRIQGHTHGGTEILRAQLLQGVKAKIQKGRGWASLDFDRWLQFGTKAGTPISGTGFRHRMTQDDHAAEALAFIRARDAKQAAEAAQQAQQTPILVEVA